MCKLENEILREVYSEKWHYLIQKCVFSAFLGSFGILFSSLPNPSLVPCGHDRKKLYWYLTSLLNINSYRVPFLSEHPDHSNYTVGSELKVNSTNRTVKDRRSEHPVPCFQLPLRRVNSCQTRRNIQFPFFNNSLKKFVGGPASWLPFYNPKLIKSSFPRRQKWHY